MVTDDLRDQLADLFIDAVYEQFGDPSDMNASDLERIADNAADAVLARFAVAGPLPEPDPPTTLTGAFRWSIDMADPRIYLSSEGQIDFAGPGYWATRKGDDPRPFAAALIAAYAKAQEQCT